MKAFLWRYGYIFCIALIIVILVINYIVLMRSITSEAIAYGTCGGLTVVLDAGHGGEDGGAVSLTGKPEKEINLAIALKTEQLMALCGVSPVMTRESDEISYPDGAATTRARKSADTKARAAAADAVKNGVLISIHQNKYGKNTSPHGAQAFYAPTAGSDELARRIQSLLTTALDVSNKRQAVQIPGSIYLLNNVKCPAVLVECGFLSNAAECALLESDSYQTKLASAVTAGFLSSADALAEVYFGGTNET